MWVAKVKVNGQKALIGALAKKHKVSFSGYPIYSYESDSHVHVHFAGFLFGPEVSIKNFLSDLKRDKRFMNIERKGNFVVGKVKEFLKHKPVYHYKLLHVEPLIIQDDGTEYWSIASWSKKELLDFVAATELIPGSEIIKIYQTKIQNLSLFRIHPDLTSKQKIVLENAIKKGYYCHPRKTSVKEMARESGLSYSTYQAHLRKAEQKVLPFYFGSQSKG